MRRLIMTALLLLVAASAAAAAPGDRQVVVVILDKIAPADLLRPDLPNLNWFAARGGVGLMNTRTGERPTTENGYATLGAGTRGVGTPLSGTAYAATDPLENGTAADILWRNTGYRAGPGNLVLPDAAGLLAANMTQDRPVQPGALGGALRRAGLAVCALGNADTPAGPGRHVVSFVMDENGVVDAGAIGSELLQADVNWPFGLRTDYRALLRAFDRHAPGAALIAIELGDTTRVDALAANLTPERRSALTHQALRAADRFLGELRSRLDLERVMVLILSPSPGLREQEAGNLMTPLIVAGPRLRPGWLVSATTKRPGIVTNTDVAPTILSFLGLEPTADMAGRPLRSVSGRGGLRELLALNERINATARWQQPVMRFLPILLAVIYAACAIFLLWPGLRGAGFLQAALLVAAGLPLALLLAPLNRDPLSTFPWLAFLALLPLGLLAAFPRRPLRPLLLLFAATAVLICADQLIGSPLAHYSLMSYSPITGARFYGIGNEYMGVLIGAAIMSAGLVYARAARSKWSIPSLVGGFAVMACILGLPGLGTNVGGFLASMVGYTAAVLLLTGTRIPGRTLLILAGSALAALALAGLLDALRPADAQTHLGRLIHSVRAEGLAPFWEVAQRKLALNFRLVRVSGWSRAALFSLLAMVVTGVLPAGRGKDLAARYPYPVRAVQASLFAAAAAFLFNDSGIIAAGTLLIFPATTWLYLLLDRAACEAAGK